MAVISHTGFSSFFSHGKSLVTLYVGIGNVNGLPVASPASMTSANAWLKGRQRLAFWVGLVGIGLIVPLVLYAVGINITWILASAGVLIGGIVLRFLIVYSGDRTLLPGETEFLAKLPSGDEEFLSAWGGAGP